MYCSTLFYDCLQGHTVRAHCTNRPRRGTLQQAESEYEEALEANLVEGREGEGESDEVDDLIPSMPRGRTT